MHVEGKHDSRARPHDALHLAQRTGILNAEPPRAIPNHESLCARTTACSNQRLMTRDDRSVVCMTRACLRVCRKSGLSLALLCLAQLTMQRGLARAQGGT